MRGPFQWLSQKASNLYQGVKSVTSTVGDVASGVSYIFGLDSVNRGMQEWLSQAGQGFYRFLDPTTYPFLNAWAKKDSHYVWKRGEATILWRMLQVLAYQSGIRPVVAPLLRGVVSSTASIIAHTGVSTVVDATLSTTLRSASPWAETAVRGAIEVSGVVLQEIPVLAMDVVAYYYLICNKVNSVVDDAQYNSAMAKVSFDESQPKKDSDEAKANKQLIAHNPLVDPCGHDSAALTIASIYSPVYYIGAWVGLEMATAFCNERLPFIGKAISLPLLWAFSGRTLLQYPLASASNCLAHQQETLDKNLPFITGLGASFHAIYTIMQYGLSYVGVAPGYMVNEALAAMLFLHFNMVMNSTRNLPLPGTKRWRNPFYFPLKMTDAVLKEIPPTIQAWLPEQQDKEWYKNTKQLVKEKWNSPTAHKIRAAVIDESLRDWEKWAKRPSTEVFLRYCGKDFINMLIEIENTRNDSLNQWVNWAYDWIPASVKGTEREILKKVMMEDLEQPLREWKEFIARITHTAIEAGKKDEDKKVDKRTEIEKASATVVGLYSQAERRKIPPAAPLSPPASPAPPTLVYQAPVTKLNFN